MQNVTIKIADKIFLTNNNGEFDFKISAIDLGKGANFSFVGYKSFFTKQLEINSYSVIELEPINFELPEVIVDTRGRLLVEKAISNIPYNYYNHFFNVSGYQKTYETINDSDYYYVDEAILNANYFSYEKRKEKIAVSITQNKKIVIDNIDSSKVKLKDVRHNWVGSYSIVSQIDFVYNHFQFVNLKELDNYDYFFRKVINEERQSYYVVDFYSKNRNAKFDGTLFIDTSSFSFVGAIFSKKPIYTNQENVKVYKDSFATSSVYYYKINDKWVLKNFHFEQRVSKIDSLENRNIYDVVSDFVTTRIDFDLASKILSKNKIHEKDRSIDLTKNSNEDVWEQNANIIRKLGLNRLITNIPAPKYSSKF